MLNYTKKEFDKMLRDKLTSEYAVTLEVASDTQIYRALAMITREIMSDRQKKFQAKTLGSGHKQVYYLCMEFLMGRSLRTSLYNLGLNEVAEQVLADADIRIDQVYDQEPDAGLGNGGLGRLAACYLDGMATDCIPGTGYSILYEYGIFKQKIVDGWQQETADNWLPGGQVWIKSHPDQAQEIRFDGQAIETWDGGFHHVRYENYNSVMAIPNDMYVAGYNSQGVSKLRLWQAKAPSFDMSSFNAGNYSTAISQSASAELISKVLYPNDNHTEGKILRLRQQYFFSAASVADILGIHLSQYGTLDNLPDKVAIQLNDTHPTLAIPEMMRILLDECSYDWDAAFDICRRVFAYTNHTVMSEALEKWNVDIFRSTLPRIWQIVCEMDRRCRADLEKVFPGDQGKIDYMGHPGRQPGPHGQHLLLHLPCHQRRVQAAQRDHQGQRLPRLLPVQAQGLHQRHQRHRLPPLAAGSQPRPDQPAQRDHRRRLQAGCLRAEEVREVRPRQPGAGAPGQGQAGRTRPSLPTIWQRPPVRSSIPTPSSTARSSACMSTSAST